MELKTTIINLVTECLQSVKPNEVLKRVIKKEDSGLVLNGDPIGTDPVYIIGFGKAAALMAVTVENILGKQCGGGFVITKYDHALPTRKIIVKEAGHPIPDENTIRHSQELLEFIRNIPKEALVLVLISGGGSALFEVLAPGIQLSHLAELSSDLLSCGANIEEINTIRKHISCVKGGQLLRQIFPRKSWSLIISDVIGDPPAFIASGPTSPDDTTFADVFHILHKYELTNKIPPAIMEHFQKGKKGEIPENPAADSEIFQHHHNLIVASNRILLTHVAEKLEQLNFNPLILGDRFEGEAKEIGTFMAGMAKSIWYSRLPESPPVAIVWGGESTVTLNGKGKGGRNQELALAFARKMWDEAMDFAFVALGTDGTDGPTDAAGAVVSPDILQTAKNLGLNPSAYLKNNDAYHFWEACGGLIKTGPTQTNVMDVNVLMIPFSKKK